MANWEVIEFSLLSIVDCLSLQEIKQEWAGIFRFGTAPDGVPYLCEVATPPSAEDLLKDIAIVMGADTSGFYYKESPLEIVAETLNDALAKYFFQEIEISQDTHAEVIILPQSIQSALGQSLFFRIFEKLQDNSVKKRERLKDDTRGVFRNKQQINKFTHSDYCLAFSTNSQDVFVVRRVLGNNGWPQYRYAKMFEEESLSFINNISFEGELYNTIDKDKSFAESDIDELPIFDTVPKAAIPKLSCAKIVLEIANSLVQLHKRGEIHGDLKPSNILITRKGISIIDSLGLKEGMYSPAMTRGWAAPEQILGSKITYNADQYPIGLMLLTIVDGVMFGEEATIRVPVGGKKIENYTLYSQQVV